MIDKKRWSLKALNGPSPFDLAMMVLSLFSVIVVLILAFSHVDTETRRLLLFIDLSICIIFMARFFYGLFKATNKKFYLRHHWIDFVASIPAIEALRIARVFQILRVIRLITVSRTLIIPLLKQRKQTTLASLLLALVFILTTASIIILLVESGVEGANIETAEQAIWWTLVTISTVGYGDYYPVSTIGHVIGAIVIMSGVSFFGVISGYMASVFVAPDENERNENNQKEIKFELEKAITRMEQNQAQMEKNQLQMLEEITRLRKEINDK
ncbi:potassium channel family protein [Shewanella olleyana]|uniref:potassium channel family protein n=1 Tax=Shewanella olleyana TaxID=135626 RepID=UPI00200D2853|nr:potassium channel family protein [Shewanella olleyana]MCL1065906.1 potassium channel family protein [Shewanella olleyana]